MIYLTGDTHGDFKRIAVFCEKYETSQDDILIILGDAGINFGGRKYDKQKKDYIAKLPITLFCIHGNHEQRPYTIESYKKSEFHGGKVYVEDEYPNIIFAVDGEIYDFDGKKTIVIGGAYSVDKWYRLRNGHIWFSDEQPSLEIRKHVKSTLDKNNWKVDVVLTHTTPLKYEPVEVFLSGIDQSTVDASTEIWLDEIENKLEYDKWYCGHFHTCKLIDKLRIMFEDYIEFGR